MPGSIEDLCARRDSLIQEIQGEWAPLQGASNVLRRAIWSGVQTLPLTVLMLIVILPVVYMTSDAREISDADLDSRIPEIVRSVAVFCAAFALLITSIIAIVGLIGSRSGVIVIEVATMTRTRKGYPTERVALEKLKPLVTFFNAVFACSGDARSTLMVCSGLHALSGLDSVMCTAHETTSTLRIRPLCYERGHQLCARLNEIAKLNRSIDRVQEQHPGA